MKFVPEHYHNLGINHLVSNERAALFAGMGLGKTCITLESLRRLFFDGAIIGALVVAPVRVCTLTWPDEVKKFDEFAWMKIADLRTPEGWQMLLDRAAHLYIVNYEMLPKLMKNYLHNRRGPLAFDVVVFDELTRAKNPDSKRIKLLRHYLHKVPRRWGLTGTPNPNSLLELFAQIRLLDDGERLGKSYAQYRDTYFNKPNPYGYRYELNPGAEDTIHARISDIALVLRSSDYLDVADAVLEDVEVPLPSVVRDTIYDRLAEDLIAYLNKGDYSIIAPNAAVLAGKLLQITGGAVYVEDEGPDNRQTIVLHDAKIKALRTLLKKLDEPALVVCNYRHERERILQAIPGSTSFTGCRDEKDLLKRWNAGTIPCLVADPRSIGHGLNMQAGGRVVIWYSLNWSRELYDQTNARVARRGQTRVPLIFRLISPGTMDDAVAETLRVREVGQSALLNALVNFQRLYGNN